MQSLLQGLFHAPFLYSYVNPQQTSTEYCHLDVLCCILARCSTVPSASGRTLRCTYWFNDNNSRLSQLREDTYNCKARTSQGTLLLFSATHCSLLRLIVRSGLHVPTFATRRLQACHHARAPSGGRWNCGQEMSGNFA
jgi:hypothetical protein